VGALNVGFPNPRQLIVQDDGKILFAGYFTDGFGVARLNADGSLDSTFHSENALPSATQLSAIALQADGKILVGGVFSSDGSRPNLIRMETGTSRTAGLASVRSRGQARERSS
jgi:Domain of unknown function (DUF5122) beta-propeller